MTKSAIIKRFLEFGQLKFGAEHGWKSKYAQALNIRPQAIDTIILRESIGAILQNRLRELGCDIEWLMTGKTEAGKKRVCTGEEEAMIERLRGMGITTLEQLEMFLDPKDMAQDLAFILRERMAKYKVKYKKIK
jgi:hypothetical protein